MGVIEVDHAFVLAEHTGRFVVHDTSRPASNDGRASSSARHYPDLVIDLVPGHLSASNGRNQIVRRFLASPAQTLIMLDDDIVPPDRFLELADDPSDIAAVPYLYFHEAILAPAPCVFVWNEATKGLRLIDHPFGRTAPAECDAMGTGIMAVKRHVLEHPEMRAPFATNYDEDGVMVQTEDIYFCLRARALGFRITARYDIGQGEHLPGGVGLNKLQDGYTKAFTKAVLLREEPVAPALPKGEYHVMVNG